MYEDVHASTCIQIAIFCVFSKKILIYKNGRNYNLSLYNLFGIWYKKLINSEECKSNEQTIFAY